MEETNDDAYNFWSKFLKYLESFNNICLMNNDCLVLVDFIKVISTKWIMRIIHDTANTQLLLREDRLTDPQSVRPGDILLTPNHQYIIVKQCEKAYNVKKDRLSVDLVHQSKDGLLVSSKISKDAYILLVKKSDVKVLCMLNQQDLQTKQLIMKHASRSVGKILFSSRQSWLDLLQIADPNNRLSMEQRKRISNPDDFQAGDIISFTSCNGCHLEGIVLKKRKSPNSLLAIDYFYITHDGYLGENHSTYDLDKDEIMKCSYFDMDAVKRERILYTAECMFGTPYPNQWLPSLSSFDFVLGCLTGEVAERNKILIGLQEINVELEAFPRILNIEKWMHKNICRDVPLSITDKLKDPRLLLRPTILVISNTGPKIKPLEFFDEQNVSEVNSDIYSSPVKGNEVVLTRLNQLKNETHPLFFICVIKCDQHGRCPKQIDALIDLTISATKEAVDVLYVVETKAKHPAKDLLNVISEEIQKRITSRSPTYVDTVFHSVFFKGDSDIQKRISVSVERQVNNKILEHSKLIDLLQKEVQINGTDIDDSLVDYGKKIKKLVSFIPQKTADCYVRHKIEILLQRHRDVKAFSFKDNVLHVFANDGVSVRQHINKYLPDVSMELNVKPWLGDPVVSHCRLSQGSKICRTEDSGREYGTLGMFVRDSKGDIYFTTCAHVIGKSKEAFTETDASAVGNCVFAEDVQSITESLDLSLVKVYDHKVKECGIGLRNSNDILVEGTVSVADDGEMENMKVYKWGATTKLTRGTYKGSLCIKRGGKFDACLHYIQGNINKNEFAKEGDSGSLICFEAIGSPQFPGETAAFIFVGECTSGEYLEAGNESFTGYCYHVSHVFNCTIDNRSLLPHLKPTTVQGDLQQGAALV